MEMILSTVSGIVILFPLRSSDGLEEDEESAPEAADEDALLSVSEDSEEDASEPDAADADAAVDAADTDAAAAEAEDAV
jgi:hypothetical protein